MTIDTNEYIVEAVYLVGMMGTFTILAFARAIMRPNEDHDLAICGSILAAIIWPFTWIFATALAVGSILRNRKAKKGARK